MQPRHYNIPVFLPELACPHRCIFCNQNEISGVSQIPQPEDVVEIIEKYLHTIPKKNSEVQIAFFGGSFTGLPYDLQIKYLEAANSINDPRIMGIRLSTRPDYINSEILEILKQHHVSHIELGAQSMDADVLHASARGHTPDDTEKASQMISNAGFTLGLQMMIGLPNDSDEKSIVTARKIVALGAAETRIYPTLVIKNTPLERLFRDGKFLPQPLSEAVTLSAKLYQLFTDAGINVLRVGLFPSEDFVNMNSLIAGPFHPNFKELVLSEIWRSRIADSLQKTIALNKVYVSHSSLNHAVGYQKSNLLFFQNKGYRLKFIPVPNLSQNEFYVDYQ